MTVVWYIVVIAVLVGLYILVQKINDKSLDKYNYEFFSIMNLVYTTVAYLLLVYGKSWYKSELLINGDLLNGVLLMTFGTIMIIGLMYYHIKHTSFFFGLIIGIFQLILYIPLAILSVLAVVAALAWLTQTKPVYRL